MGRWKNLYRPEPDMAAASNLTELARLSMPAVAHTGSK